MNWGRLRNERAYKISAFRWHAIFCVLSSPSVLLFTTTLPRTPASRRSSSSLIFLLLWFSVLFSGTTFSMDSESGWGAPMLWNSCTSMNSVWWWNGSYYTVCLLLKEIPSHRSHTHIYIYTIVRTEISYRESHTWDHFSSPSSANLLKRHT